MTGNRDMYCENCGKKLEGNARFCIYCGAETGQADSEEALFLNPAASEGKREAESFLPDNRTVNAAYPQASLKKGTVLENTYEIMEAIGFGGGGIVYRARHLRLQTDVVVKKIRDEIRGRVRTRREADILKNLKHPFLPRIYDFIETPDGVYTVMDFVQGENLDEAVKRYGRFPQKLVKKWAEQLGAALDYLHSQKPPIIHSDIKPANIMLTQSGDICLIDFNISLAMGETMESAVGISAGFSPPEQYRDPAAYTRITYNYMVKRSQRMQSVAAGTEGGAGSPKGNTGKAAVTGVDAAKYARFIGKGIDTRSDIFSLGVTLYYMITGIEPPADFDARIPIAETGIVISEGFAAILERMMAVSPGARYQNGGEFLKAVRNCHKLDRRYIAMRRRQMGIQAASLICLGLGIVSVFGGFARLRTERNSAYYGMIREAEEVMNMYEYDEAKELLETARELSETRVEAYEKGVYLLYLKGDYENCIKAGEEYINTTPFLLESREEEELFGNIYYIVGNAYLELEDYASAKKLFQYALEYNDRNSLYYRDYAIALAKSGQIKKAERELENGIDRGMADDSIYMVQGEIAHVRGKYEEALEHLDQTISLTDDAQMKKRAILLCADIYKTIGNEALDQEISLLEKYMDQFESGGSLILTEYLAEAYARKARVDVAAAQEWYEKSLALFSAIDERGAATYQMRENMAILYENMRDFDRAEEMLLEMTEEYPERYEAYKRLAYLEADREQTKADSDRDYHRMLEYYEQAEEKYSGKEQDPEMERLDIMMQELQGGGWL